MKCLTTNDLSKEGKMLNIKTRICQFVIDFAEARMDTCEEIGSRRAVKYGNKSLQWRMTFLQERIWDKVGYYALGF